jgi:hypothetical protein
MAAILKRTSMSGTRFMHTAIFTADILLDESVSKMLPLFGPVRT